MASAAPTAGEVEEVFDSCDVKDVRVVREALRRGVRARELLALAFHFAEHARTFGWSAGVLHCNARNARRGKPLGDYWWPEKSPEVKAAEAEESREEARRRVREDERRHEREKAAAEAAFERRKQKYLPWLESLSDEELQRLLLDCSPDKFLQTLRLKQLRRDGLESELVLMPLLDEAERRHGRD